MSSRKASAFIKADRDLLTQIATPMSLALDNALAYGRGEDIPLLVNYFVA